MLRRIDTEPLFCRKLHARCAQMGVPLAGSFELTARCNFQCKMCYVRHRGDGAGELTTQQWLDLGRQAAQRGMIFLQLTGGEPLLREDFREIYSGLKKLGLVISLNTNGSLLDGDMLAFLRKDPPVRLNISLYGGSNEIYRSLCGVAAFDRVAENILRARDAGLQLRLTCAVTPDNVGGISDVCAFARENALPLKGTTYMFPPVRVNGGQCGVPPCRFGPEEAAEHMLRWWEKLFSPEVLVAGCGHKRCFAGNGVEQMSMECRAGRTAFWITWDGRMLPCGMFDGEGYALGEYGLDGAWEQLRQECAAVRLPAMCGDCAYRSVCHLCAASCLAETGGFDRPPEYICRMTKHLNTIVREKYG